MSRAAADPDTPAVVEPGRYCPTHYRYAPSVLAREPDLHADTLFVIGGLYGNAPALERVLDLANAEPGGATLVFNGDFNWFNIDAEAFAAINRAVLRHVATRGNVETELGGDDADAGCGCAYPEGVSNAEVERSNAIIMRLRETAHAFPTVRRELGALPMHLVAEVAGTRIGIVHGDAESLAGWSYAQDALAKPEGVQRMRSQIEAAQVRIIASSHTCLPVGLALETAAGSAAVFNNGAAGMPNFLGTRYGVVTRISTRAAQHALYGTRIGAVHVEALAVHYDHARWIEAFLANWPQGSPAHASYFGRLTHGPSYDLETAMRDRVSPSAGDRPIAHSVRSTR